MDEFEFSRNITIGQYLAIGSFVHRMDPRFKLLCFVLIVGAITFSTTLTANAILLVVVFGLVALSRIPIRYALSGLKPAIPIMVVIATLQILFSTNAFGSNQNCVSFFRWGPFDSDTCGIRLAIVSAARFVDLLILSSLLTFSTTITELTLGTERLLAPLQRRFNVPVHELALTMTIALRFVPTLAEELERIVKAQVSRGAQIGRRSRFAFAQQMRTMIPLIVPLFLSALRRAEDLILAMEARCYMGGKGRTSFLEFESKPGDWAALVVVALFSLAMLLYTFPF
jgi:energy-coupling factor transport system permease protein